VHMYTLTRLNMQCTRARTYPNKHTHTNTKHHSRRENSFPSMRKPSSCLYLCVYLCMSASVSAYVLPVQGLQVTPPSNPSRRTRNSDTPEDALDINRGEKLKVVVATERAIAKENARPERATERSTERERVSSWEAGARGGKRSGGGVGQAESVMVGLSRGPLLPCPPPCYLVCYLVCFGASVCIR